MASTEGGMDIEEVAEKSPEKIVKLQVDPSMGLMAHQARRIAAELQLPSGLIGQAAKCLMGVYQTFWECDASMVEINPFCIVEKADGSQAMAAVDAKISIDDNALYRHAAIQQMRDLGEEAPLEIEASRFDLNYIKLMATLLVWSMVQAWPWPPWTSSSITVGNLPISWMWVVVRRPNK